MQYKMRITTSEKRSLAKKYIDEQGIYSTDKTRLKLGHFTAGIPGAGKTETAITMRSNYKRNFGFDLLHIDIDQHRENLKRFGYAPISINRIANSLLEATIDEALHRELDFIHDSTFAYPQYEKNLIRAIKHKYHVVISFVLAPIEVLLGICRKKENGYWQGCTKILL
jgi:UDP-N-acetylglucosamine kinase